MTKQAEISTQDGLLELAGATPIWIWAHPCRMEDCDCRLAMILTTSDGRAALLERGAALHRAWHAGSDFTRVGSQMTDLDIFLLNIDSVDAFLVGSQTPLDVTSHPHVRAVLDRLDGEVLDAIGRFYDHSRGKEDRATRAVAAKKIVLAGWSRGDMVEYGSLGGARRDLYHLDGKLFEAHESYCPTSKCTCGEVIVGFEQCQPGDATDAGHVTVHQSGGLQFAPSTGGKDQLDRLWSAFRQRHPRYRQRLARRDAWMKSLGSRLVADSDPSLAAPQASVGRNDPCPCGSGKKYKKCCAGANAAGAGLFAESST